MITVTITGTNDDPAVVADTNSVTEDAADVAGHDDGTADTTVVAGDVLTNDSDVENDTLNVVGVAQGNTGADLESAGTVNSGVAGSYGTVTINTDGTYEYALDNTNPAVQALGVGDTITDVFTYTASDGNGGLKHTTLTITINGANDDPEITVTGTDTDSAAIAETDTTLTASGTLSIADVDTSDDVTMSVDSVATGGTYTGTLPANADLAAMLTVSGGLDGTQSTNEHGVNWTFNSGSEYFNAIPEGETVVLTYTVKADDGNGGTTTHDITITITGTNDAPVVQPDTNSVTEDVAPTTVAGNVITGHDDGVQNTAMQDTDVDDGDSFTLTGIAAGTSAAGSDNVAANTTSTNGTEVTGTYGTLKIGADGSYSYQFDTTSDTIQSLSKGQSETDTFTYTVKDSQGDTSNTTLTIDITGTNDAPDISVGTGDADTAQHNETSSQINLDGTLSIADKDTSDTVTMSVASVSTNATTILGGEPYPFGGDQAGFNAKLMEMLSFTNTQVLDGTQTTSDNGIHWNFTTKVGATTYPFDFVPAGDSFTITYTVKATDSSGQGNTANGGNEVDNDTHTITITITGTNDTGSLVAESVTTNEDTNLSGDVFANATQDPDAGEELAVTTFSINGTTYNAGQTATITSGGTTIGTLVLNTDGSYTFDPANNYSGPVPTITYAATSGNDSVGTSTLDITVNPVSDAPGMGGDVSVETFEDTAVALNTDADWQLPTITDATDLNGAGTDGDWPERLGLLELSGVPDGAVLSYGGSAYTATGSAITIEITDVADYHINNPGTATLSMTQAEFEALQITPPKDAHQDMMSLTLTATEYEVDGSGNKLAGVNGATATQQIDVEVKAVTDDVDLKIDGSDHATQADAYDINLPEDTATNLKGLLSANYEDTDGSEQRSIKITNAPGNADIVVNGVTIAGGSSHSFDAGGLSTSTNINDFPDLNIQAGEHISGDINGIKVELVAEDTDSDSTHTIAEKSDAVYLNLHVAPVAGDLPAEVTSETVEDGGNAPSTTGAKFMENLVVTDTDGTESITGITFTTIPTGWVIKDHNGNTVSQVDPADIPNGNYKNYTAIPPAHSSADASITLSVATTDTVQLNGASQTVTATNTVTAQITVTPVAEKIGVETNNDATPDLTMTPGMAYTTPATEDTAFPLNSDGFHLESGWTNQDNDGSEETFALLSPQIWDADTNSYVDAIGATFTWNGGSATYDGTNGVKIPVGALDSVQFKAPPQSSGQFRIKVEAHTVDTDPDTQATVEATSGVAWLTNLQVMPDADLVTLGISQARGDEDSNIPLDIRPYSDDPDETFQVTIEDIPPGAELYYNGLHLNPGPGTSVTIYNYEPGQLTIKPPPDSNVDFTLKVSAMSVDTATFADGSQTTVTSQPLPDPPLELTVHVQGVADGATLTVADKEVTEVDTDAASGKISLENTITGVTPDDNDGSETATLVISGLPEGFNLEGGSFVGGSDTGREWMVSQADINNGTVSVVVPENFNGKIPLQVKVVTTENDGAANPDATSATINLTVTPSPEATMNLSASGNEDSPVNLNFDVQPQNGDTDETISSVWINKASADNAGVTFTNGIGGPALTEDNGWYKVAQGDLGNIYAQGPANKDGAFTFDIKYEVGDPGHNGLPAETEQKDASYTLHLDPVTDETATNLGNFVTDANSSVSGTTVTASDNTTFSFDVTVTQQNDLNATGQTADADGSEQLEYFIVDGVPAGVSITGGTYAGHNPGGGPDDFTGRWIVPVSNGEFDSADVTRTLQFTLDKEAGLFTVQHEYDLTVTAYSKDGTALNQESSVADWKLVTEAMGNGQNPYDPALVTATARNFTIVEDEEITLGEMVNFTIDNNVPLPDPASQFSITISGLPAGTEVEGMTPTTVNGETVWTASYQGDQAALDQLTSTIRITPPENWNENNDGSNFTFDAQITSYTVSGTHNTAGVQNVTPENFTPATDEFTIGINASGVAEGEDVNITIDLSNPADAENAAVVGDELYIQIDESDLVENGSLAYGGSVISQSFVNGVPGLAPGYYYVINNVTVSGNQGSGQVSLVYTPAAHASGDVKITAHVVSSETGASDSLVATEDQTVAITAENSGYDVTVANASGDEDTRVQILVGGMGLSDIDGSETAVSAVLSNVPGNYIVFAGNDANAPMANNIGDGTWELPLDAQGNLPAYIAVQAPENVSGTTANVELTVFSGEAGQTPRADVATFDLEIVPVVDGLSIDPTDSVGTAGTNVAINLNPTMNDTDGSETATVTFTGFGVGNSVTFNAGTAVYDWDTDTYTITDLGYEELGNLTFTSSHNINATVTVFAHTVETANNAASTDVSADFQVIVGGGLAPGSGDDTIILNTNAAQQDGGAGEDTLVVGQSNVDFTSPGVQLLNMEIIDLDGHGQQEITLNASSVTNMTDGDSTLIINGDVGGDMVNLESDWADATPSTEVIGGVTYNVLDNGNAHLKIEDGVTYNIA